MNKSKIMLILILVLLGGANLAFAGKGYNLTAEYGPELKSAPFAIRYKFEHDTGKKWTESTLVQRKNFLTVLHQRWAKDDARQRAFEKAKNDQLKEIQKEKKAQDKALHDKLKARAAADKATADEEKQDKENFQKQVAEQKKQLDDLRRQQHQD